MFNKSISTMLVSMFLLGCATPATGPLYSDFKAQQNNLSDQAKVTVFRQNFEYTAKARSARIKVDGNKSGGVDIDGFISFAVTPGQHTLSSDLPDHPGACELPVELVAGNEYFYEVMIRGDAIGPALLFGVLGAAVESSGKKCGGLFAIHAVDKNYAEPILQTSRLTK